MKKRSGCLLCGGELTYQASPHSYTCCFCERTFQSVACCPAGHFICDDCHQQDAVALIESYCNHSQSVDPFAMADALMHYDQVTMYGPEHHYLVPAVLIAAWYNATGAGGKSLSLALARKRAEKVPGGFCGTHGSCGAGIGAGIFISVITGATPMSTEEWRLSNLLTGRCLTLIAEHGGPRCCKRDVFLALSETVRFVKEQFGISLGQSDVSCDFSANSKWCKRGECPFYSGREERVIHA